MIDLRRLTIHNYKNINGTYSFENSKGYVALIGLNGSGKSNLLESISIIFDGLINNNGTGIPFEYEIEYGINGHIYTRKKRQSTKDGIICKAEELEYPSSLIACYSGEDNRLWDSGFKSYYRDFFNKAIGGGEYIPRVLYINKLCWKIAFISLLFSEDENVKNFITDKLHIDIESVNVQFVTKEGVNLQAHDASNWYNRVKTKYADARIQINDLKNDEDVDLGCTKYPEFTNRTWLAFANRKRCRHADAIKL